MLAIRANGARVIVDASLYRLRGGLPWLNDGSCIRLGPEYPGHVWAYDFVEGRTHDGRKFRILAIIDEASQECVALLVARRIRSADVLAILANLFILHGPPAHIRSDKSKPVYQILTRCSGVRYILSPGLTLKALYQASTLRTIPFTLYSGGL